MKLYTIASGSSGNSTVVSGENSSILVDCGVSCKRVTEGLKSGALEPDNLAGIFITHEHSDHIKGLRVFLKKYRIPVFATGGTIDAILTMSGMNEVDRSLFNMIKPEENINIGGISVKAFSIPHDAADPVGYSFTEGKKKVCVATDLGKITDIIESHIAGADAMVLEANHDVNMLEVGFYPYALKMRILSDRGHLSNENSGRLLSEIWGEQLKYVFLGHLSAENNMPLLALQTVMDEMLEAHPGYDRFTKIMTADRDCPMVPVNI